MYSPYEGQKMRQTSCWPREWVKKLQTFTDPSWYNKRRNQYSGHLQKLHWTTNRRKPGE